MIKTSLQLFATIHVVAVQRMAQAHLASLEITSADKEDSSPIFSSEEKEARDVGKSPQADLRTGV